VKHVGLLLEPTTVVEKGIYQAYEIQRRLKVWCGRKAAVIPATSESYWERTWHDSP